MEFSDIWLIAFFITLIVLVITINVIDNQSKEVKSLEGDIEMYNELYNISYFKSMSDCFKTCLSLENSVKAYDSSGNELYFKVDANCLEVCSND